jgi:hypothetical protein
MVLNSSDSGRSDPWARLVASGQRSGSARGSKDGRRPDRPILQVGWPRELEQSGLTSHATRLPTLGGPLLDPGQPLGSIRRSGLFSQVEAPFAKETTYKSQRGDSTTLKANKRPNADYAGTTLLIERDREMASGQTLIDKLPPQLRKEQEEWAQSQLKLSSVCIGGFKWDRVQGGYRCRNRRCFVTDALLAEGRGGYYDLFATSPAAFVDTFSVRLLYPDVNSRRLQSAAIVAVAELTSLSTIYQTAVQVHSESISFHSG